MTAAARWEPERQRRALRLMGIEPPVFRAGLVLRPPPGTAPAPAAVPKRTLAAPRSEPVPEARRPRLRILGLSQIARDDALLGGILRSLKIHASEAVFGQDRSDSEAALPTLAFGPGHGDGPVLPGLSALRADPRAKRTAWQETLRPLRVRMLKS